MDDVTTSTPPAVMAPPRQSQTSLPFREDCWSEEATHTLVEAWGDHYLELNRGNLRQKHWQEVADAVNARHGHVKKARRTDVQCKNRIDTLKKKYKIEKARVSDSNGTYVSQWPFYSRLDALIGDSVQLKKTPSQASFPAHHRKIPTTTSPMLPLSSPVPVGPRSSKPKRPATVAVDDSFFRRNFSAAAAAAAAAEDLESSRSRSSGGSEGEGDGEGLRQLARAIVRFGEIYERVEEAKQRHMIELEKQRMQFAKDLEFQRMQLFMDTQVQLEKIKRAKRSAGSDSYS